jgi:hypothetical protein
VINKLEIHDATDAGSEVGAAGTTRLTPAECLVAVCAGTAMCLYGLGRKGIFGWLVGGAGLSMVAKGFNDTEHRFDQRTQGAGSVSGMRVEQAQIER